MTKFVSRAATLMVACLALLMTGCASTHSVLRYEVDPTTAKVWPSAPEKPRYRYVGSLTGEENIQLDEEQSLASTGTRFFKWLVGLGSAKSSPVVLQRPQGVMVDQQGRVYVTDVSREAVYVFDPVKGKLDVWEMASAKDHFLTPIGIAPGADGEILVTDAQWGYVARLDHDGHPLGTFGKGQLSWPTGIARDPDSGHIYVAETHAHDIKVFDKDGKYLRTIGKRGVNPGEFNSPTFLSITQHHLYVTDTMNARVQVLTLDGKPLKTFGRRGVFIGDMPRPKGVAADNDGNIYVVESYFDYLLIFNAAGQLLLPIGGTGDGVGQFYQPGGVWIDHRDRIYVADTFNGRIVVLQFLKEGT
ncbi:MAG: 6-bladed beta-propeller [Gammaproteobacteria bacterium]